MALLYVDLTARLGKRGQISYCAHFTEQEAEAVGNRGTGESSPSQEEGKASSVSVPSTKPYGIVPMRVSPGMKESPGRPLPGQQVNPLLL